MDTSEVLAARARAEAIEAQARRTAAEAQAAYGRAMAALVDVHGATAVARELSLSRGRIYQIMAKAQ